eukprot:TRINITY_DN3585_c0_g1_i1.p1 TRINITY_DN3585_c0_g1~~TRINITY_DN3585_c0_g1_i1.p1  ORF type:complete len:304 (+),score=51.28 TRINITY_DN3585_c0_g1_i1:273-1184(+)
MVATNVIFISPCRPYELGAPAKLEPVWSTPQFKQFVGRIATLSAPSFRRLAEGQPESGTAAEQETQLEIPLEGPKASPPLPNEGECGEKCVTATSEEVPHHTGVRSFLKRFIHPDYVIGVFWLCLSAIFISYYVGTVQLHLLQLTDDTSLYVQLYMIFSNCAGLVLTPLMGILLDKCGCLLSMAVVNIAVAAWAVLACIPVLPLQVVTFVVFGVDRVCIGAVWAAYVRTVFGMKAFGQLCGVGWFCTAIIAQIQTPLVKLLLRYNKGNFLPADLTVGGVSLVALAVLVWMKIRQRRVGRANQK